jgi:hypothetical protein
VQPLHVFEIYGYPDLAFVDSTTFQAMAVRLVARRQPDSNLSNVPGQIGRDIAYGQSMLVDAAQVRGRREVV